MESQEDLLGIFPFDSGQESVFYTTEFVDKIPLFKGYVDTILMISFFQAADTMMYERSVYTILDFLGDIGGLFDALGYISKLILFAFSVIFNNGPSSFIVARLFKQISSFQTSLSLLESL